MVPVRGFEHAYEMWHFKVMFKNFHTVFHTGESLPRFSGRRIILVFHVKVKLILTACGNFYDGVLLRGYFSKKPCTLRR